MHLCSALASGHGLAKFLRAHSQRNNRAFLDIRGFTTISENVSPQELVRILNKYFSCMSAKIIQQEAVRDNLE